MNKERENIIIVRKKKGHGHGHHGGAWKVAFADFMTAMFALFLVLWLVNQSSAVKVAVAGYFNDPMGRTHEGGTTDLPGPGAHAAIPTPHIRRERPQEKREELSQLAEQLRQAIEALPQFAEISQHLLIEMTPEGLRIQLLEDSAGVFFETGSATPRPRVVELLRTIGAQLATLPNGVVIDGYTDARPYSRAGGYSNWELSTDRANMARRVLTEGGLADPQVQQVRGHAERDLRNPDDPTSASNRRVTITMLLDPVASAADALGPPPDDSAAAAAAAPEPAPRP